MKTIRAWLVICGLFFWTPRLSAQFAYATNCCPESIAITGYTNSGGNVTVPGYINGLPVTEIDAYAFEFGNFTNLVLPDTLTQIYQHAFAGCSNLTELTMPDSVTFLDEYVFEGCLSLTNIVLSASLGDLAEGTFWYCTNLASIVVPDGVTNITGGPVTGVFGACTSLTNINLPASLVCIGGDAFSGCSNLPALAIPPGVVSIGDAAFGGCVSLTNIAIPGNVTNIGQGAFSACAGLRSITIPNQVQSVEIGAFQGCTNLTNVVLPPGLQTINPLLFWQCSSLSNIIILANVSNISYSAFEFCSNLAGIFCESNAPAAGTFFACTSTVYYLPGTTGWGTNFGGLPTALWNPSIQTTNGSLGIQNNQFGFTINGTANIPIVIQATADPGSGVWVPVQTCALTNGSIYFGDPAWTSFPSRFYSIVFP